MRTTFNWWIWFIFAAALIGCSKDKIELSLRFQLQYQGDPLVILKDYSYPDGKTVQFTRVSFFISELVVKDRDESVSLKEIDFVNLSQSHADEANAAEGYLYLQEEIPFSNIDQISFNIGLTPKQNETVPADYVSGEPLARPGEYWVAWDSYIFVKIEGWVDLDGDGAVETGIALHMGSNNVMRNVSLDIADAAQEITMVLDLHSVFKREKIYDIATNPQLHSLSQLSAAEELADNLVRALQIMK